MKLIEVDLVDDYGFDVPNGARAAKRVPCSACGLSKRHLFDKAALDGGYDVVATGHNLDDEAAVLFGNVLRWHTEYLGSAATRCCPPATGFPRKVKPLVRLGEREMAAYCVLRGIDYIVEECPMAAGNRHLGYKEALNAIEVQSPGSKHAFYFGFLDKLAPAFEAEAEVDKEALGRCVRCGAPSAGEICAFCRLVERASDGPGRRAASPLTRGREGAAHRPEGRRYLVTLKAGGEFHTHAGYIPHDELIGRAEGTTVKATKGLAYTAFRPTLARLRAEDAPWRAGHLPEGPRPDPDARRHLPRRPGARVGRRIGRAVDGAAPRRRGRGRLRAARGLRGEGRRERRGVPRREGVLERYRVEIRDCYEGIDETALDRIVLDLPEPWQVVKHAERALRPGGILVAYTPTIMQAAQLREALADRPFLLAETIEVLHRGWHIDGQSVRPDHRMVAHTGFLTSARLLAS